MAQALATSRPDAVLLAAPRYADFVEAIGEEVAQYSRESFASAGMTARDLLGACTFEDVVRLQADFAKRSFADFVERSTKLSELGGSLLGASIGAWTMRAKS